MRILKDAASRVKRPPRQNESSRCASNLTGVGGFIQSDLYLNNEFNTQETL